MGRGSWGRAGAGGAALCADHPSPVSFQNQNLLYELPVPNHMLLFACKSSPSFAALMQHYKAALREFQNKVCGGRCAFSGGARMGIQTCRRWAIGLALLEIKPRGGCMCIGAPTSDSHIDAARLPLTAPRAPRLSPVLPDLCPSFPHLFGNSAQGTRRVQQLFWGSRSRKGGDGGVGSTGPAGDREARPGPPTVGEVVNGLEVTQRRLGDK